MQYDRKLRGPGRNARGQRGWVLYSERSTSFAQFAPDDCYRTTRFLGLDCEMVGSYRRNLVARVSIVNEFGWCIYDTFVSPGRARVTDFRYNITGLTWEHLADASPFSEIQDDIINYMNDGHTFVGHDLRNDFRALSLDYDEDEVRDTALYTPLQSGLHMRGSKPSLRSLADHWLDRQIHTGVHDSIVDARVAMALYKLFEDEWEGADDT